MEKSWKPTVCRVAADNKFWPRFHLESYPSEFSAQYSSKYVHIENVRVVKCSPLYVSLELEKK